ncbi:MAG: YgcG family protein, partial [Rubrivivax sp.]
MRWLTAVLLVLACAWAQAQDVQPVPALSARVVDQTGTLDAAQRQALEDELAAYEQASGPQIAVLLVKTTAPEDIAAYAQRVADAWKIGRREVGDGVLIVVAKNDRKMRIEVAKALEGAVPDLAARQIIDAALRPAFQAGDYAGGLKAAIARLQSRIAGEGLPAPD